MTALWGISFDATPISGVVVEFVKTARHFADRGHRVLLDLGYDIKADKDLFFQPYRDEGTLLPDWVELARVAGSATSQAMTSSSSPMCCETWSSVASRNPGSSLSHTRSPT